MDTGHHGTYHARIGIHYFSFKISNIGGGSFLSPPFLCLTPESDHLALIGLLQPESHLPEEMHGDIGLRQ